MDRFFDTEDLSEAYQVWPVVTPKDIIPVLGDCVYSAKILIFCSAAKVALTVDRHSERSEESPYYGGGDPSLSFVSLRTSCSG